MSTQADAPEHDPIRLQEMMEQFARLSISEDVLGRAIESYCRARVEAGKPPEAVLVELKRMIPASLHGSQWRTVDQLITRCIEAFYPA